jgi:nucleoside-diphosphate kinase
MSVARNVIHASESPEIAEQEIKRFFTEDEIYSYKRVDEDILYEADERN